MPPGGTGSPGRAISSPVARMPIRGCRCTKSQGWFAAAARPTSRAVSRFPAGSSSSPVSKSRPRRRIHRPARTVSPTRTRLSAASASSCKRMPSAPPGRTAPVKMRTASPGPTVPSKGCPAGALPTTRSKAPCSASAARTAIAVHGGDVGRRLGEAGEHRPRQHPPAGRRERHRLGRGGGERLQDAAPRFLDRDHGAASQSPDLPPDFRTRRTASMRMPRSSALHMS